MNDKRKSKLGYGSKLVTLFLIASLVLTSVSRSIAAPPPPEDAAFEAIILPPEAQLAPDGLVGRSPASRNPKLDSTMADLVAAARVSTREATDLARSQSLRLSGNRVHVQIVTHAAGLQGAIRAATRAGGEVTKVGNDDTLIQGWLPVDALETVAAQDDVYFIRRPAEVQLFENLQVGNSTTEGLAVINGPAWHTAGYTGSGVKVAIIDGGFIGYTDLLGVDLPASVTVKNFVDGENDSQVDGTTKHGTACAEIIHDIVPDATLYLAKVNTNLDLAEAVAWAKDTHGVDIISTSLGWYNLTPGDGSGEFANLVQSARNAGILWATAAGNDREAHWGGLYSDPNANDVHNFNDTQEINYFGPGDGNAYSIPSGYVVRAFLRWDDWTHVNQDYNLYLLRWNGSSWDTIAASTDVQNGSPGQSPTEFAYAVTSGTNTAYGFVIVRSSSNRNVNFEVFVPKVAPLDELLYARSLANLADAPGAMTVAALDVTSPYPQESYSSEGPTNGPGGAETGGFTKPDIAAFANVATESYSGSTFNGTSAATPHVAGAAALVLSAYPSHTPDQLQSFLEGRAIDMGAAGMDTIYGHGRLYLGAPPAGANTAPTISGLPDQSLPVNTSLNDAIDLWAYADDAEDADADLTFSIVNAPDPNAGVTIDANRYIDINPTTGWTGQTDVEVQVQDTGGLTDSDTFRVTVSAAADKTWNGSVSTDWHTADNWTPAGVPTSGDDVLIPNVARDPVISAGDAQVDGLIIDPGAVLDLTDRTLTVEGTLTNNGTLKQTQGVATGDTTEFLRITNQAGNQTKYYGVDITPSGAGQIYSTEETPRFTLIAIEDATLDTRPTPNVQSLQPADAIDNTPDPNAGVSIESNRYVNIVPTPGWTGQTTVVIRVTDPGGLSDTDAFLVTVGQFADIEVTPTFFDESVPQGETLTRTLTISNTGVDDLLFVIDDGGVAWLSQDPIAGTVAGGAAQPVNVTFDATGLAAGDYSTDLTISNNDPDENPVTIPVTMHVTVSGELADITVSVSGNQFCAGRATGVKRCFDVSPSAPLSATVRFYFQEAERNGQPLNDLLVLHYADGEWVEEAGPYTRGGIGDAQYVEAQNVDDFSLFALGKSGPIMVYLPLVVKRWPPLPYTPVLNAISNPDGDGNYTVSWSAAELANTYTLQEDDNAAFSSPTTAYGPGTATSTSITGRPIGTYYYRVKATNSYGDSGWSNVQSVQVTPPTTFYATDDAVVIQRLPSNNYGNTTDMWVGYGKGACIGSSSDLGVTRSLVKFNLSAVPAGTSISSARLYLRLRGWCRGTNTNPRSVTVYRTSGGWSESSVTWNNMPGIGEAHGSTAVGYSTGTWYSFDVTSLVRGWVNGSLPNYGMTVRGPEGSGSDFAWFGFYTSESAYDPYIRITYTGMAASEAETPPTLPVYDSGVETLPGILVNMSCGDGLDSFGQAVCSPQR